MSKVKINLTKVCALFGLLSVPALSHAELRLGIGLDYVSGLSDVADLYIDNVTAPFGTAASDEVDDLKLPVGLKFTGNYEWDSGVRVDFNIGPLMLVMVDLTVSGSYNYDHSYTYYDIPVGLTGGYSFIRNGSVSPYVRVGGVHHIVSGDFNESTSPGLLAAVGIEFMRMRTAQVSIELAVDQSEVEFDKITCSSIGTNCRTRREAINTSDILFGVAVKF
jgi:hypothetical protein